MIQSTNIELQVRTIVATAAVCRVDSLYSDTLLSKVLDDDATIWFWREIEREFDIAVTKAQRAQLSTIGQVVHYLKVRSKAR